MILALVLALAHAAPVTRGPDDADGALARCRALDDAFDTKALREPCGTAAADTALPVDERVEALRRLAFAHILNGDEALAGAAFLDMLTLSPSAELPSDASPRVRALFDGVKRRHGGPSPPSSPPSPSPSPTSAAPAAAPAPALVPAVPAPAPAVAPVPAVAPAPAVAPPGPDASGWVTTLSLGGVLVGLAGVTAGAGLALVASDNAGEWERSARGETFPRNEDDPLCAPDCVDDGLLSGWTQGYGTSGENGQVGQGARFVMVAVSADNAARWRSSEALGITGVVVGGVLVVTGVALLALPFPGAVGAVAAEGE